MDTQTIRVKGYLHIADQQAQPLMETHYAILPDGVVFKSSPVAAGSPQFGSGETDWVMCDAMPVDREFIGHYDITVPLYPIPLQVVAADGFPLTPTHPRDPRLTNMSMLHVCQAGTAIRMMVEQLKAYSTNDYVLTQGRSVSLKDLDAFGEMLLKIAKH